MILRHSTTFCCSNRFFDFAHICSFHILKTIWIINGLNDLLEVKNELAHLMFSVDS